jgi:hypothetical protein
MRGNRAKWTSQWIKNRMFLLGDRVVGSREHALADYNAWIVRQFVRYFRKSDTTGNVVLGFGAGIGTLSVFLERDSGVRPLVVEVDLNQQVALRNRNTDVVGYPTAGSEAVRIRVLVGTGRLKASAPARTPTGRPAGSAGTAGARPRRSRSAGRW